jgi:hypothetical protein
MAYYLSGRAAHLHCMKRALKPLKLDQGLRYTVKAGGLQFEDSCGRGVYLPEGHNYRITGTCDSNGYVVTFDDNDTLNGTRYLTAEQGCKLC